MFNIQDKVKIVFVLLFILMSGHVYSVETKMDDNSLVDISQNWEKPLDIGRVSDEWTENGSVILLGQASQTLYRPAKWQGIVDKSAVIHLAWDEKWLYFKADVLDDKLMQASTTGAEPWQGDSFELFFNVQPGEQRTSCFRQISLVPALQPDKKLEVICPQADFLGVEGKTVVYEKGYSLECRIPWSNLAPFRPKVGALLGFQIMLDDRDSRGRKSQLCWYPSAATYILPLEMGVLRLGKKPVLQNPILAGPSTMCVTHPTQMKFSIVSPIANVTKARIKMLENSPALINKTNSDKKQNSIEIPLETMGNVVSFGEGVFDVSGIDGTGIFMVELLETNNNVAATTIFKTELVGQRYTSLQSRLKDDQKRVDAISLKSGDAVGAEELAGVGFWLWRLQALYGNEVRPERVDVELLNRMMAELSEVETAIDKLEKGQDPYDKKSGSLVKAYKSPLTGEFRPHSLFVPESYNSSKPLPLIVLLHGIYGDDRHLFQMLKDVDNLGAIVYQAASYRQFDWSDISAAETWKGLDQVLSDYSIERNRIYLVGYHIGGRGVLQLAMDRPGFFAALGSMYSGIDTHLPYPALQLYPEYYEKAADNLKPFPHYKKPPPPEPLEDELEKKVYESLSLVTLADNITGVPMVLVYGEGEPDAAAERLALLDKLSKSSSKVITEYVPGAQHGSNPPQLRDPKFYKWLLAQKLDPTPDHFKFVVTDLRNNEAWFTRIDSLFSALVPGRVEFNRKGNIFEFTTTGVDAFTPIVSTNGVNVSSEPIKVVVDGVVFENISADELPLTLIKSSTGNWKRGVMDSKRKRHGLSGPIDDFQHDSFLYVYGTNGTEEENAALEKAARKFANRGLGAEFNIKADKDVTDEDIKTSHIVLVGTPTDNSLLAKIADRLPLKWNKDGLQIGDRIVKGDKAAGCMIYPNPLMPNRYVVVVTSKDVNLYSRIWKKRSGVDYVMGSYNEEDKNFDTIYFGRFDSDWKLK